MRKFIQKAKNRLRALVKTAPVRSDRRAKTVEEATRRVVERYGDVLRSLADK